MRRIAVVTVGRSDYGILRPVLQRVDDDVELELALVVSGAHLLASHGETIREIEQDGFAIAERVEMLEDDDSPEAVARGLGAGVAGFGAAYSRLRPELLLVLGDRLEMLAAVVAALPFSIPVAHVHGGETTEGAIDDAIRHAITKLSHLHFPATQPYADRLVAMGEEPWRITVSGAPGIDNLEALGKGADPPVGAPFLIVTWHAVTREPEQAAQQLDELLAALAEVEMGIVFTHPNADPGRTAIVDAIKGFTAVREEAVIVTSLGTRDYFELMRQAAAMVGNSSSGIIEAASFELPVVNIGSRQRGRLRAANVIDVEPDRRAIAEAIRSASSPEFRALLVGRENLYGDGRAAERIVERLRTAPLGQELLIKRFCEAS